MKLCADPQVVEITLLNTTVQRWDGARCYYPNVVLNANPLLNLTRSENKTDNVQVSPFLLLPPSPTHMRP